VRRLFGRSGKVPPEVFDRAGLAGERVLASAAGRDGTWLLGTREALVVVRPPDEGNRPADTVRLPWEDIETADWDRDEDRLRVAEVGTFGQARPVHVFTLPEPGLLLQLVRERVTASVLLQRRVVVSGKRGLMVVARRAPTGRGEITWTYEFDEDVDPDDPAVREAAALGLRSAQDELGPGPEPG
jgi:hypothetical protein